MARKKDQENTIETEVGSAGPPQRVDRSAVRRRSESPNMLTEDELEERQERLRQTRRSVPPPAPPATRRSGSSAEAPPADVPETDCAEPPG